MNITKNFKLSEFTKSATAEARGLDNTPDKIAIDNITNLCRVILQPFRDYLNTTGKTYTIVISSGYRSQAVNAAVCGSKTSDHLTGCAADIYIYENGIRLGKNEVYKKLLMWLMRNKVSYNQLIHYENKNIIHIARKSSGNKNQNIYRYG